MADDDLERDSSEPVPTPKLPPAEAAAEHAPAGATTSSRLRTGGKRTARDGALDHTEIMGALPEPAGADTRRVERTQPLAMARTAPLEAPSAGSAGELPAPTPPGKDVALAATVALPHDPAQSPGADIDLRPFGPYGRVEVLREQGSIGLVARGHNTDIGRWELLKFLRAEYQGMPEVVRQFRGEGRVLALLSHPNVVQVFASYELDGHSCLALEFLEGESLEARVDRAPLDLEAGTQLFLDAARGLAAAHELGLLHRDIKPENLFVVRAERGKSGGLKLIDFGLAMLDRSRRSAVTRDPALESGALGGTPLFMAPELWLGQEPSVRADLYALGLSFFYAFSGRYPFELLSFEGVRSSVLNPHPFPSVGRFTAHLPAGLIELVDRLLSKQPEDRPATADEVVAELIRLRRQTERPEVPVSGPYRGLAPFTRDERGVFFGRERETIEICERLRRSAGVVLVGPSGAGKSSIARAGVLPAIEDGALGGGVVFSSAVLSPGADPLAALAQALASLARAKVDDVRGLIAGEPERLASAVCDSLPATRGLVILVDQLEELSSHGASARDVELFARALAALVRVTQPRIRVVCTLRADRMDGVLALEPLRQLLTQGFYPLRPLLGGALRDAIVLPAQAANYSIEDPALPDQILAEAEALPHCLPLLSFALHSWWRLRDVDNKLLPKAAWTRIGGIAGALVSHAEQVLDGMHTDQRRAAELLLVRLVAADRTRARVSRAELLEEPLTGAEPQRALDQLLQAKLLTELDGHLELAHEALISGWPRVRSLLDEAGEDQAFRARIADAARQWDADGRSDGALWDGALGLRLLAWFKSTQVNPGQRELAFIDAVRRRAGQSRALRGGAIALVALAVASLLIVGTSREQSLRGRVLELEQQAKLGKRGTDQRLAGVYAELATRRLPTDPAGAVRAARLSRDFGQRSELDLIGWRAARLGIPRALPANPTGLAELAFDADSAWLAAQWRDGSLRLLELGGAGDHQLQLPDAKARLVGFSADSGSLFFTAPGALSRIDSKTAQVELLKRCEEGVRRVQSVGSGDAIAGSASVALVLQCQATPPVVHWIVQGKATSALPPVPAEVFAARPGWLAASVADELKLYEITTGKETAKLKLPAPPAQLAFVEGRIVVGYASGELVELPLANGVLGKPRKLSRRHRERLARVEPIAGGAMTLDEQHLVIWRNEASGLRVVRDEPALSGQALSLSRRRSLAWVSEEQTIDIWTADARRRSGRLPLGSERVSELQASPDGRWLAAVTQSGRALLFDLDLASSRHITLAGAGDCRVAANGLAIGCLGEQLSMRVRGKGVQRIALPASAAPLAPQGPLGSAPALGQSAAELPQLEQASPTAPVPEAQRRSGSARWVLGHDRFAAWVTAQGDLAIWNKQGARTLELGQVRLLTTTRNVEKLALVAAATSKAELLLIDGTNTIHIPGDADKLTALAFSPDESLLAAADSAGVVYTLDAERPEQLRALGGASVGSIRQLVFSDDHREILSLGERGAALSDVAKRTAQPLPSLPADVSCAAFSQSGRALVLGTQRGEIWVYDRDTHQSARLGGGAAPITDCVRSPSEERFVFAAADGSSWAETYDLRAIWMLAEPDDPSVGSPEPWRGLVGGHGG